MKDVFAAAEYLTRERLDGKYSTPDEVRGFALAECLEPDILELLIFTGPIPAKPWNEETAEAVQLVGLALGKNTRGANSRPYSGGNKVS